MHIKQFIISKCSGVQGKVSLVALSQTKPGKTPIARAAGARQESGSGWVRTCGPRLGFCLYHIKTNSGEGLSPPLDTAQGAVWASLNTHKMSVEKRRAWGSTSGTGSRRPDLWQSVRSSTASDLCVTLDEPLPLPLPLFPTTFYLPLSHRL